MKAFLPDLLPRFTALIGEAERSSNHTTLGPALLALEAMGLCLEEHLPLVLPALMRLIAPGTLVTILDELLYECFLPANQAGSRCCVTATLLVSWTC